MEYVIGGIIGAIITVILLLIFRHRDSQNLIGLLVVDETDPEEGGGLYFHLEAIRDPKHMKNGEIIQMKVFKRNSH